MKKSHEPSENDAPVVDRIVTRALIIGPQEQVLLIRSEHPDTLEPFWFTPGGGVDDGETSEAALRREVAEELGGFTDFSIGQVVWEGDTEFIWRGTTYRQRETIHLCRSPGTPSLTGPFGIPEEGILEARWWPIETLEDTALDLRPGGLRESIIKILNGTQSARP